MAKFFWIVGLPFRVFFAVIGFPFYAMLNAGRYEEIKPLFWDIIQGK